MVGDPAAGAVEAALAVGRSLSLRQPEGCDINLADRRHRRRASDRRRGRNWRAAACGLLLRTDHPDLGGAAAVGDPGLRLDRTGGPGGAYGRLANGGPAMNPRRLRLGFIFATAGMLAALVLPLSGDAVASLPARPMLLALTLAAVLLFAAAAWSGGLRAGALGPPGGFFGAAATPVVLARPTHLGAS